MVFDLLRMYQLRMKPLKCAFGVTSGKFLGFVFRYRGIEIDQAKVDTILKMPEIRNIYELKSLQGKLAYLRRFISNLAGKCQPFSRLMKKGVPFEWDHACSNAFDNIKSYLKRPPVLAAPIPGKPLILYIAAHERSVGALLAQENSKGKENSLYYLSRMMKPNELKYSPIEKLCLALVFSIQKLKHYFQAHVVRLISQENPIKFVMSKHVLSDRLARWYLQFQQFEIVYVPQKAMKGQALADFLADHPTDDWGLTNELPDEDAMVVEVEPPWKMYFDGASHCEGADSELVINQLLGSYKVKRPELRPYHDYAQKLIGWLGNVTLQHVPRKENKKVGALATLASILTLPDQMQIIICQKWIVPPDGDEDEKSKLERLVAVFEAEKHLGHLMLGIRRRWTATEIFWWPLVILVATDYFLKWAEDVALKEVKKENVANFIRVNIIYHFGIPSYIITDNGKSFNNKLITKICDLFGFKQRNSSMYYAATNGLVEAFNKTLCNLLKKVVSKSKRDWHDKIEEALWAYRTTHRTPTQATPYSLVYGVEAVLPLERQIPSLQLTIQQGLTEGKRSFTS
ncbi:PREDICTED: uncharacterized protein LOC109242945 [Nicotiana attenuata]|uniref:uncharacterized protein LOC109242945 n=1 Tax=Nicotiana attenuata TaxID=49451 RepID=UPI0009050891|nr:PREDICTED: uncharacterized protein LOC109242945 [Nicotiana attenuata]